MRAAHTQQFSAKQSKDKYGNNQKRHFATWKYFVKKLEAMGGREKADEETKQKFYISSDCERILDDAQAISKREAKLNYNSLMQNVRQVGIRSQDKLSLDYWGLPKGLVD